MTRDYDDYRRELDDEYHLGPMSPIEIRECPKCHQMCRPYKASGVCSWCLFVTEIEPGWRMPKLEDE